jgi:hypothetical protein
MHSTDIPEDLRVLVRTHRKELSSLPVGDAYKRPRREQLIKMLDELEEKHWRLVGDCNFGTPECWRAARLAEAA